MNPSRWQQISHIFDSALRREPGQRAVYLDEACAGDEALRREVESLLDTHDKASRFIEEPAIMVAAKQAAEENGASLAGRTLTHYQVLSLLGVGGMGEVYLAQDARLGRRVALKLLPDAFMRDDERVRRFRQEARVASALNHPNILTIYEIGEDAGRSFIATEYVAGETLRARLSRTARIKMSEVLDIAVQMASALSAAHAAGVVHRDIKPENVMLRTDGLIKVLDFGLAKLTEGQALRTASDAPTLAQVKSAPGVLLGTLGYMSPEQARGQEVNGRTDIFSLGVVLYEMIAGCAPFAGETPSDVLSLILQKEPPPLARHAPDAPAELQRIVGKALTKNRDERYQTVKDLLIDLKGLRRRIEVEADIELSVRPETNAEAAVAPSGERAEAATVARRAAQTGTDEGARTTSGAVYLTGGVKRHRRAAALVLAALAVALAAAGYVYFAPGGRTINSLAVLPLANAGGDPDAEYLSDGITESLINSLSQLPNLKVMSRNSAFRYKGRDADARDVGRALGVEAILTGRVTRRGDDLVVSVELVDAKNDSQLWGEQYDRRVTDILGVQREIALEVSEKLRARLTGKEQRQVTKKYTDSAEAYELYLKGRYFWSKGTEEATEGGYRKAIEYYQQAIEKDPNYAQAYAGMANAYESLGSFNGYVSPKEAAPQAKAAVLKALALDETLDDAHYVLANLKLYHDWDFPGAEREYRRAIELNPNNWLAHSGYGTYLELIPGRFDEAAAARERGRQLNPTSAFATMDVGYPLYYARRYDQAIERYRKGHELDPNFSWGHLLIGEVYVQKGMYEEAIAEIKKSIALSGGNTRDIATLGHAYAVSGKRGEALKVLDELQQRAKQKYVPPYFIALIYTGLGEKDEAFAWLEKAYEERHPYLISIKVDPVFDGLRTDPRFADLMRRVGLPQ